MATNSVERSIKNSASAAKAALREHADPHRAQFLQGFFKTHRGGYGEGDLLLGVTVPDTRKVLREFKTLSFPQVRQLVRSRYHEDRLLGLLILVAQYQRGDELHQQRVFDEYLLLLPYVNNWDLVDSSAAHIVGAHLYNRSRRGLDALAKSKRMWDRRVAIVSTHYFIRKNEFHDTIRIAERLVRDEHDLMHKATGWMLREVGKRDRGVLEEFLAKYCTTMPRTMLRYAIEHFPEARRKAYLAGDGTGQRRAASRSKLRSR